MTKIKLLFILAISFILLGNAYAESSIDKITVINDNTIEITTNINTVFSNTDIKGEIKVLKDIPVSFSAKDIENSKKIIINLSSDLNINKSYSLITILGINGNIDFNIGEILKGEIINKDLEIGEDGLEKINIIDARTIELFYTSDLVNNEYEFKLLSDVIVSNIRSEGNNILNIETGSRLETDTSYIFMILDLYDSAGNILSFNEDLYDFSTTSTLIANFKDEVITNTLLNNNLEEDEIINEGNIEEIALNSAKTPDTGPTTWILILIAIIANIIFFFRKKIIR